MTLEEELRATLEDRATRPSPHPDLWENVAAGVWRRRRRQRAAAVGAAALALAAAAAVPPLLAQRAHRPPPAPPAVTPTVDWVVPNWPRPAFPMHPSWLPPGTGEGEVSLLGPNTHLVYETDSSILSAEVGPLLAYWEVEALGHHTTKVNGRNAEVRTADTYDGAAPGDEYVGVRWRLADGRWAQVLSFGKRTESEVLRFARGLTAGSVEAPPPPFTFETVPPGYTLQQQFEGYMCVAPAQAAAKDRNSVGVCVLVTSELEPPDTPGEPGTVNGLPATYYSDTRQLTVELAPGRHLQMTWDQGDAALLTREEAFRFAEGIRVQS
ncbi:hypothetical protein JIG36_02575 [Actinoplanes sp. LDG1-06]|uniref:DUF4367 domain-containing protein n=1 Tax=Paractinoplanes ovalisporus TaxID=2810368 RepID=A0ABS2A3M5_9ACTN|nr:hypothetical protein [Actinoplanes ovalisporus]MBM2614443.1 hypothetical protein [Actinoplanes ovalisporus]